MSATLLTTRQGVCSLILAGSALLVHLRKKCIIREHLQKLEAMSNV